MKRTTAPQQGEVTSLTTLLREGMSRTMKQPGLVPGESSWPETDTGIRIGEGSPRVVETTGTGRVGGSEEGKFMVSPGLDVGVHSQGEDRDRGLTISDPSGNTESRVQAASEREGGPDDHRERDPGGIVASPLARGPDSLPCASVTGDAGRGVEEFQVQSGATTRKDMCGLVPSWVPKALVCWHVTGQSRHAQGHRAPCWVQEAHSCPMWYRLYQF